MNQMTRLRPWTGKNILVTGGAGYLGSRFIRDVAADPRFAGVTVRILDNLQRETYHALMDLPGSAHYEYIEADLLDRMAVRRALHRVDAVVHLAALVRTPFSFDHPTWTEHVNHWGTAGLVEACLDAGVGRFVFASSASVYGPGDHTEESDCRPIGPYSQSKLRAEQTVTVAEGRGLAPTTLRFATVYGYAPAIRFDAIPNRFAYLAAVGRPMTLHGSGAQVRPIVHVADASAALRLVLLDEAPTRGRVFNVGSWNPKVHELLDEVQAIRAGVEIRETDQHALAQFSLSIDSSELRGLGWAPEVEFRAGIGEVIRHVGPFAPVPSTFAELEPR